MKNWNNLNDFFLKLNERTNYLVLRNYEEFIGGVINVEHPDIDILCSDRDEFLKVICSESRSDRNDKIHRRVMIGGKRVDVDVRYIGDGYYDTSWAINMLNTKCLFNDLCFVMNQENYYYSLLYHALIQKYHVSADYANKLNKMANMIGVNESEALSIKTLETYMLKKGYQYTYPINPAGIINLQFANKDMIDQNKYRKLIRMVYSVKMQIISFIKNNFLKK